MAREVAFLPLVLVRAALISYFTYLTLVLPIPHLRWLAPVLIAVGRALFAPIFLLGKVLPFLRSPFTFQPFYLVPQEAPINQDWLLRSHMVAGVVTWTLLFYTPSLFRSLRRRAAQNRGRV